MDCVELVDGLLLLGGLLGIGVALSDLVGHGLVVSDLLSALVSVLLVGGLLSGLLLDNLLGCGLGLLSCGLLHERGNDHVLVRHHKAHRAAICLALDGGAIGSGNRPAAQLIALGNVDGEGHGLALVGCNDGVGHSRGMIVDGEHRVVLRGGNGH